MRRATTILTVLLSALALGACGGDSAQDDALARVCDARADIRTQLETLRGLSLSEVQSGAVSDGIEAIRSDLKTIRAARSDLSDERRSEVQAANDAFTQQLRTTATQLASGLAAQDAEQQVRAALDELAGSYRETFDRIECPEE